MSGKWKRKVGEKEVSVFRGASPSLGAIALTLAIASLILRPAAREVLRRKQEDPDFVDSLREQEKGSKKTLSQMLDMVATVSEKIGRRGYYCSFCLNVCWLVMA